MTIDTPDLAAQLRSPGVAVLERDAHPYGSHIGDIVAAVERVPVEVGIGDDNRVDVARLRVDPIDTIRAELGYQSTQVIDEEAAARVLAYIESADALTWWRQALSEPELVVARAQANLLLEGGKVGRHRDEESNAEYVASIVIGLSDDFDGGDLVLEGDSTVRVSLNKGIMVVARPDLEHWVEELARGQRRSLVFFFMRRRR